MKVSIIIPTINRYDDLENSIDYLLNQNFQDYEIIIIDQSNDNNVELITKLRSKANIHYLYHKGLNSASAARNIGIKKSSGEILLFVDDDVVIEDRNFIYKHYRHYQDDSIPGVFGCPLELNPVQHKRYLKHWMSTLNPKIAWLYFPSNYGCSSFIAVGRSNNLSVRRTIAIDVKGMNENYQKGAHREEGDFCLRVHKKYGEFLFDPQASLKHIGNKDGGIRSWNDNDYVKAEHNMVGAIYFDMRVVNFFNWPHYLIATLHYLFMNKTILTRPSLYLLTLRRILKSLTVAIKLLIKGPSYLN